MTRKRFLWKLNLLWNWYIHRQRKKQKTTTTKMWAKNRSISSVMLVAGVTITIFMCMQPYTPSRYLLSSMCISSGRIRLRHLLTFKAKRFSIRATTGFRITTPSDRIPIAAFAVAVATLLRHLNKTFLNWFLLLYGIVLSETAAIDATCASFVQLLFIVVLHYIFSYVI